MNYSNIGEYIIKFKVGIKTLVAETNKGREVTTPLSWYPTLLKLSPKERQSFKLRHELFIEWPTIGYGLSLDGMVSQTKEGHVPAGESAEIEISEAILQEALEAYTLKPYTTLEYS